MVSMVELRLKNAGGSNNMTIPYYPLTYPQKTIWHTEKVYSDTGIGNIAATLRLKGDINYNVLERALNLFIQKNDAARLRMVEEDGQPKQYITEYTTHQFRFCDFSGKDITELYKWEEEQAKIPFRMIDSELIHFDLIKVNENDGGFFVKAHHLISDAWTMSVLGNQVMEYYTALKNAEEIPEGDNASFIDYIRSEEEYLNSERFQKDKEYWDKEFETYPEKTVLKNYNSTDISAKARRKTMLTPKKLTEKIYQYCAENKTSPFVLFVAALAMYINRVTSKQDINFGTTTLNRSNINSLNIREKEIVGMFTNIAPIRIRIDDHMDFKTFVKIVSGESISLLKHQKYPFDLILKEIRRKYKITDTIFDIVITYQNARFAKEKYAEQYITRWHFNGYQTEALNISINDRENEGHLIIDYSYLTDLYNAKEIEFINQHIINILWHALDNPTKEISKLNMLSEIEIQKVLYKFNDTSAESFKEKVIYDISGELAGKIPEKTKCYILDKNLNLIPISIPGELYISNKDSIIEKIGIIDEKPIANPFIPEEKIYKTDHMARWYPNGDIVILGKNDTKPEKKRKAKEETLVKIAATFTAEPIGDYIKWWGNKFGHNLKIEFAGYNQVFQELLDEESSLSKNKNGINILLVRFEDFIRNENEIEEKILLTLEQVFEESKQAIIDFRNTLPLIIPIFPVASHLELSYAIQNKIEELNIKIKEIFSNYNNIYILDLKEIQQLYGIRDVFDIVKDKEAHMPFTEVYYAAIGTQVARKICAIKKQHFKVIVLDCDNTLWQGVCGENRTSSVKIQGAYKELQEFMLQKHNEGMLLAICSKNNEKDVIRVFNNNPEMILGKKHITNWKINWQEKSRNIKEIAKELNLGLDSFIFVDDNPLECSKMIENCPEVLTLQLPSDEEHIPLFLKHVWAFDRVKITQEDTLRTNMYYAEQKRKQMQEKGISLDDYIKNLKLKVSMRELAENEIPRAAQLTQRTNQFNLSTIRITEDEMQEIMYDKKTKCFVVEASDKFGDYGIIGLIILKEKKEKLVINTFLLSCRILGRKVEHAILSGIRMYAEKQGKAEVEALFIQTAKNRPIQEFIEKINWNISGKNDKRIRYSVSVSDLPEKIEHIAFYYNKGYKKNNNEELRESKEVNELKHDLPEGIEENKKVTIIDYDLCDIEILKNTKHNEHLLPIVNFTGKRLLKLPIYESVNKQITEYQAPTNETEEKLTKIWEKVLRTQKIGIDNDYFELGGDSLSAVNIIARIYKEFNVELTLIDIFQVSTIRKLAKKIADSYRSEYEQILPVEKQEYYELSSAQKRMYILHQIEKDSTGYNECQKILIEGNLDKVKLEEAFKEFIKRHEALRTGFEMIEGEPVQKIYHEVDFRISNIKAREDQIEEIAKNFIKAFDLSKPPLMRAKLIELESDKHILLLDIHHIVIDGTSFGILIKEILALYEEKQLESLKVQYKDFANWQNKLFKSEKIKKQEEYWIEQYKSEIPVLNIPTDYTRPPMQSFNGRKDYFTVDKTVVSKLREQCDRTETTMFMMLFAAFNVLLSRYTGQEDIVVGTPVAGRTHADIKETVGVFVNSLPIRTYPIAETEFIEYVKKVKETILQSLDNQDYQYEHLVEKLSVPRDASRNPIFDVLFALQNMEMPEMKTKDLKLTQCKMDNGKSKLDMSIFATEKNDRIEFELEYCTDLYEEATIKRFEGHFLNILNDISDNPKKQISDIEIMSWEEKHEILYLFNDTQADYPKDKTIHQLFEEQVERTPDNVAIVFKDKQLTYKELNAKANQLARVLRDKGVKPDTIVGIMVERSFEMIIGIMGILKAGGAYLPIDPEYPKERIQYMLEDSQATILLTQKRFGEKAEFDGETIDVNNEKIYTIETDNLININKPNDLIYVIYTSGSTGKPKGVMIEHISVINRINWGQKNYPINENSTILQKTPYTFDVSVWELLWWTFAGAKVCMLNPGGEKNPEEIIDAIEKNHVTTIHFVPSMLSVFLYYLEGKADIKRVSSLKQVFASGEALNLQQVTKFNKLLYETNGTELYNLYGPTEATVEVSYFECSPPKELKIIPIGKPIDNINLYILDKNSKLASIGISGELCIGGDGVARGYLNKPELTSEKFISNPHILGGKLYKTGDLARWLPDGNIEYLGRIDFQVKIRGNRIELGEIENRLLQHGNVEDAVVIVKEDKSGNKYLCAYVVCCKDVEESELKNHLLEELPGYMVPAYFVKLREFPLTPSGKVNRKELEKINYSRNNKTLIRKSEGEIQQSLEKIYRKVLNIKEIGVNESFFELGGDSLQTIKLTLEIYNYFDVELSYIEIYNLPTIEGLSKLISEELLNGYRNDIDIGSTYMLLNDKREKNIFAFPPITGFGLAFNDMAKNINEFSLYAFNYIEDKDKIDKYLKIIKNIQNEGPYILLGFSAGADIVMDLASRLKEEVIIILMDGFFGKVDKNEIEEKLEYFIDYSINYANLDSNNKFLYQILRNRIRSYMNYLADKNKFVCKIDNDIYFLQSEEMKDKDVNSLKKLTTGTIVKFKAYGKHFELLKPGYIERNSEIIEEILKTVLEGSIISCFR